LVYGGDRGAQAQLNLRSSQPKSLHNTFTVEKDGFNHSRPLLRQFSTAIHIFILPVLSYSAVATAIWQPCTKMTFSVFFLGFSLHGSLDKDSLRADDENNI
jgi:hypothetical protein